MARGAKHGVRFNYQNVAAPVMMQIGVLIPGPTFSAMTAPNLKTHGRTVDWSTACVDVEAKTEDGRIVILATTAFDNSDSRNLALDGIELIKDGCPPEPKLTGLIHHSPIWMRK